MNGTTHLLVCHIEEAVFCDEERQHPVLIVFLGRNSDDPPEEVLFFYCFFHGTEFMTRHSERLSDEAMRVMSQALEEYTPLPSSCEEEPGHLVGLTAKRYMRLLDAEERKAAEEYEVAPRGATLH